MKRWHKFGLCVPVVALMAGGSWAWGADRTPTAERSIAQPHAAAPAAAVDTAVESKYTPITPCRIVDTRKGPGRLSAGATRSYYAVSTGGFVAQGGTSGGCGIPYSATAIQATVTSIAATGKGWLRAYPSNAAAPGATFLNYTNAFNASGAGSITLYTGGVTDFKVTNYGYATNLVIDVQGYYVKPMWAVIAASGSITRRSRLNGTAHTPGSGEYDLTFDRDISTCGVTSTPVLSGYTVGSQAGGGGKLFVFVKLAGTYVDAPFYATVTC